MQRVLHWLVRHWAFSAAALLIACGALGYALAAPPPPREIRIATGTVPDSAYTLAAEAYAQRLSATGFRVRRIPTQGSVENLALLRDRRVDIAIVQGGIADPVRDAGLESLGAVFAEPVWAFARAELGIERLAELRGRRVAVGTEGSGTRVLALALLAANGIGPTDFEPHAIGGAAAAAALNAGSIDAAILVSATISGGVAALLRGGPAQRLLDFAELAEAYAVRLPFLSVVRLPRGGVSLAADQPAHSHTLLAPVASVVVHEDIHPKIVALVVGIMQETHRARSLFAAEGSFPNALAQDLPLNADAERYNLRGQTVLQRWLPFWVAVWVERLLFVLLPVLGLALPLIRFGPALYASQMEARVWRHYDTLRGIESEAEHITDPAARAALRARLEALEGRVARLALPVSYRRHVFALRRDIAYVREALAQERAEGIEDP